ncbi:nitroreductase family protein [Demequina sp. SO4-18]|uniref:nitroreductase family protein n=1 Tax=Demequina sp. SO4-18 TaxID=3401026 RepID=UPI003B5C366F
MNFVGLSNDNFECQVTKEYHRIEKGLSLSNPRRPFGSEPAMRLASLIPRAWDAGGGKAPYIDYATDALAALEVWNETGDITDLVAPRVRAWQPSQSDQESYGALFSTRRSVRDFEPRSAIPLETIRAAIADAQNTPSVCNRQPWRTHYYEGEFAQEVLRHHSGSAAFASQIPAVLVVTSRTGLFSGTGERNQRWIDGGMFAMSVVWALHSRGAANCFLNWSRDNSSSNKLRAAADIPEEEDIIVLIAVGRPRNGYRVARSTRRDETEVLEVHGATRHRNTIGSTSATTRN